MALDLQNLDPGVDPGSDFYLHANGGWLAAHPIPPGYGAWGSFEEVVTRNEALLRELLEHAAQSPEGDLDRKLGDAFTAGMDLDAIESHGLTAIQPQLDAIAAVGDVDDLLTLLPALHRSQLYALFGCEVTVDHDDSTRHLLWVAQTGLGLPTRDSYFDDSHPAQELRAAYVEHIAAQLANVGVTAAGDSATASDVLAFETRLAGLHMKPEELRDPGRTLNRHDVLQLDALAPALDLPGYLLAFGAGAAETVNVQNPALLAGLHEVLAGSDAATLRAYLAFVVVRTVAGALPQVVDDEAFSFYGRRIGGQDQQHERTKRVIDAISGDMGEALSQRFVEIKFPPSAKARALGMVDAILDEMRASLDTRPWMSDATRARGRVKLDAIGVKIGYPDKWRDWSGLDVDRANYAANRLAAARFEVARQLAQLAEPVDTTEWEMAPHSVNAYYHPVRNEIVFPAGILQPPFFDAEADDALNFGGIGTVIAHEITHGFDDQGRRYDADGAFRDWWEVSDGENFTALADRIVEQFDEYTVLDGVTVNGRLTLGENIADLGGLALAQRAHTRVSEGAPDVDGLPPAQRFFLAYASLWRANVSEELQRTLVQVDMHSPRHLRVRGPIANLTAFRDAFGLTDDAPALRPPAARIEIW